MTESWFQSKIAVDYGALRVHTDPLHQLFSGNISSETAAEHIISGNLKRQDDTAWRLWNLLFDAAAELPQHHETIIEVVLAIQAKHDNATDDPGLAKWMTEFPSDWRDRHGSLWSSREGNLGRPAQQNAHLALPGAAEQYSHFNAFSAKLLSSPFRPGVKVKSLAWSEFKGVLESPPESYDGGSRRPLNDDERRKTLLIDVFAAAQWALYASDALRKADDVPDRGVRYLHAQEGLWEGGEGFTLERWEFWKDRFQSLVDAGILDASADEIVKQAVGKM
ncbi:uncharacterized protein LTHEOB_5334 [Neofusicoccum parvum]|uniref:Uncharacterized protein LTHEOB_5334 n=1 Tax=Neofusicoccum parvum TaxID=310453 RepID=A0ACB5RZ68_9PEZI|nr:uncharacterized protein LTHEOB_5334 [Neofusicoccum parvum]